MEECYLSIGKYQKTSIDTGLENIVPDTVKSFTLEFYIEFLAMVNESMFQRTTHSMMTATRLGFPMPSIVGFFDSKIKVIRMNVQLARLY